MIDQRFRPVSFANAAYLYFFALIGLVIRRSLTHCSDGRCVVPEWAWFSYRYDTS